MFTANLAGSSGSHHLSPSYHRPPPAHQHHHHHRDHDHGNGKSGQDSNRDSLDSSASGQRQPMSPFAQGGMFQKHDDGEDDGGGGAEDRVLFGAKGGSRHSVDSRVHHSIHMGNHEKTPPVERACCGRKCSDFKAPVYLLCVALVIIGVVVLVVLTGLGYIHFKS